MIVEDYKNLFYIFLLKNKIYKRYFEGISYYLTHNPYHVQPIYSEQNRFYDYICDAFSWSHENSNHEKRINWEAMHNKWVTILKDIRKQCQTH